MNTCANIARVRNMELFPTRYTIYYFVSCVFVSRSVSTEYIFNRKNVLKKLLFSFFAN